MSLRAAEDYEALAVYKHAELYNYHPRSSRPAAVTTVRKSLASLTVANCEVGTCMACSHGREIVIEDSGRMGQENK